MSASWTWDWIPYGTEASFGDNFWFDWVRVFCLVGGVVLALVIGRVLVEGQRRAEVMPQTQVARFVSLLFLDVYVSFTEFAVFGTPATPRLAVGIAGLGFGIYGVHGMRRKQRATPPIR